MLIFIVFLLDGCIHSKPVIVPETPCSKREHINSASITIIDPIIIYESRGMDSEEVENLSHSILEDVADKASRNGFSIHTEADFNPQQRRKIEEIKSTLQNSRSLFKTRRRCNDVIMHLNSLNTNETFILIALQMKQTKANTQDILGRAGAFDKISSNLVVAAVDVRANEVSWIREAFFRSTPSGFFLGFLWDEGRLSSELSDALELVLSSFPTRQE